MQGAGGAGGRRTTAAAAAFLIAVFALTACTDGGGTPAPEPKPDRGTPLAELDTTRLAIAREAFCDAVPPSAVVRALGEDAKQSSSYGPGDRVRLTSQVKDVAHEYGCRYRGPKHSEARAWVFAPPVTRGQARRLAADAQGAPGCEEVTGAPAFGRSSAATRCPAKKSVVVTFAGLFGDAWLSCSVAAAPDLDPDELDDRASRWCAAVAAVAGA